MKPHSLASDVYPQLKKMKEDGKIYCATYSFGLNAIIVYDPAKTQKKITSWKDVYSGDYKGRIGKIDKSNEQIWRPRSRSATNTARSPTSSFRRSSRSSWKT